MFWFMTKYMRLSELTAAIVDVMMIFYRYNLSESQTTDYARLMNALLDAKKEVNGNYKKLFYPYDMQAHEQILSRAKTWCAAVMFAQD